jgi:orotidine-5'-phosphate decarboxylase
MNASFAKLQQRIEKTQSHLCVGLDVDIAKIPERFQKEKHPQLAFNKWLIEQTAPYVAAYKLNLAFYEARGAQGMQELEETLAWVRSFDESIWLIGDAKRGDIGNTSAAYATSLFDHLNFDAATINPYLGQDAIQPFLDRQDKVSIVLCKTSNPGSGEIQDALVVSEEKGTPRPLYEHVAERVAQHWNQNHNCMLVVGATYPEQLAQIRKCVGDEMFFLIPGIGAQGGDLQKTLEAGLNAQRTGVLITTSRQVIYAEDPKSVVQDLHEQILGHMLV